MTYERARTKAGQRTEAGKPSTVYRLHDGWVVRPAPKGRPTLTAETAAARAKALTEAGRPSVVERTKEGAFRVVPVLRSMPLYRRDMQPPDKVKLTEEAVAECRDNYRHGRASMREMARRHGVGYSTVWQAIHAMTWAKLPVPA